MFALFALRSKYNKMSCILAHFPLPEYLTLPVCIGTYENSFRENTHLFNNSNHQNTTIVVLQITNK